MPFNGSGTYTAPSSPGAFNPAVTGQQATPAAWNTLLTDLSTALSLCYTSDGQTQPSADLPMNGHVFTDVGDATARDEFAAAGQVQDGSLVYAQTAASNTLTATLTPAITAYAVGQTFTLKKNANPNTTAVTLDLNGIGAGTVVWPDGSALVSGNLPANCMFVVAVQDISTPTAPVFHLLSISTAPLSASTLTTRGDLLTRSSTIPIRLGIGAADTVLSSDGTDLAYSFRIGAMRKQKFTANGTYTPHAKMAFAMLECVGGGGGGGGIAGDGNNMGAGGGGSGGYSRALVTAADIGASKAVTIGAAGTAGTAGANNGGVGGATSVGVLCVANGGLGGLGQGAAPLVASGVLGGAAGTGDDVAATGAPGGCGMYLAAASGRATSGAGGSSYFGGGGRARVADTATSAGFDATAYGGGGGGAVSSLTVSNAAGGAGFAGYVIITEYCVD